MLARFIRWGSLSLVLILIQTSLIASLPGWLSLIPLVITFAVFGIQYFMSPAFVALLSVYGLWVDLFDIGRTTSEILSWTMAGIATVLAARWLFSNRSWYGLMACAVACSGTHAICAVLLQTLLSWRYDLPFQPFILMKQSFMELLLLLVFLWILFVFARQGTKFFRRIS
jgi:hypothetical protein